MQGWNTFWEQMVDKEGYRLVLQGLRTTAIIAVAGLLIGFVIGCLLATFKLLPGKSLWARIPGRITDIYVAIFRGTPMVVQLLLMHFVIFPALGVDIPAVAEAILAFGMNSGAYVSEIMRGGILSVDKGQTEAGRAIGFGYGKTMLKIVLPQAVKNVIPTLGNEFVTLIKETSVVSFIAVVDLTKAFQAIGNSTYEYIIPYLMLAVIYLVIVLAITGLVKLAERRLRAGDRN